jgi:hypothetical protein
MTDEESELADDPKHPIPSVQVFDSDLTFDGGGAYLGIAIGTPLDASSRSLARLNEKLRLYLDSFWSELGRQAWGTPKEGKMKIYVHIHPESSQEVFKRLDSFSAEARSRGVDVVITREAP